MTDAVHGNIQICSTKESSGTKFSSSAESELPVVTPQSSPQPSETEPEEVPPNLKLLMDGQESPRQELPRKRHVKSEGGGVCPGGIAAYAKRSFQPG